MQSKRHTTFVWPSLLFLDQAHRSDDEHAGKPNRPCELRRPHDRSRIPSLQLFVLQRSPADMNERVVAESSGGEHVGRLADLEHGRHRGTVKLEEVELRARRWIPEDPPALVVLRLIVRLDKV